MEPAELEGADGGDAACWAHLVCRECGAIESEGHRASCRLDKQGGWDAGPGRGD